MRIKIDDIINLINSYGELKRKSQNDNQLPYGNGNPYYYCVSCERSMIEVSYKGHYDNCEIASIPTNMENIKSSIQFELKNLSDEDHDYINEYLKEEEDSFELYDLQQTIKEINIIELSKLFKIN
jgi:hypothetical protein